MKPPDVQALAPLGEGLTLSDQRLIRYVTFGDMAHRILEMKMVTEFNALIHITD